MRKFFVYELLIGSVPIKITFDTKTIYLHIKGFEHDVYNRNDTNFTPESTTIDIIYFPSLESYHVTCNHRWHVLYISIPIIVWKPTLQSWFLKTSSFEVLNASLNRGWCESGVSWLVGWLVVRYSGPLSHMRLRARDHYTSSSPIGGKGGAGPSSLHATLEGPTEYVNARWM